MAEEHGLQVYKAAEEKKKLCKLQCVETIYCNISNRKTTYAEQQLGKKFGTAVSNQLYV
jgi:hypothetical protein